MFYYTIFKNITLGTLLSLYFWPLLSLNLLFFHMFLRLSMIFEWEFHYKCNIYGRKILNIRDSYLKNFISFSSFHNFISKNSSLSQEDSTVAFEIKRRYGCGLGVKPDHKAISYVGRPSVTRMKEVKCLIFVTEGNILLNIICVLNVHLKHTCETLSCFQSCLKESVLIFPCHIFVWRETAFMVLHLI